MEIGQLQRQVNHFGWNTQKPLPVIIISVFSPYNSDQPKTPNEPDDIDLSFGDANESSRMFYCNYPLQYVLIINFEGKLLNKFTILNLILDHLF